MYILDTETASLNGGVCQIAWLHIDNDLNILDSFESLVNPERPIEEGAQAVHGISDEDVRFSPTLAEVVKQLPSEWLMAAYNVSFDLRMIKSAITPTGSFCVLKLARQLITGTTNHKLEVLQKELNLPEQKSHSALGDVHTTLDVLRHCLTLTDVPLATLIARQQEPEMLSKMPFGKHKGVPMIRVPRQYRDWLLGQSNLSPDLKFTLEKLKNV